MREARGLIRIGTVYNQIELALISAIFEQEGLWVILRGERHSAVDPALAVALGGVAVQVHSGEIERARALLRGYARHQPARGVYTEVRLLDIALALLLAVIAGVPPPARNPAEFYLDANSDASRA